MKHRQMSNLYWEMKKLFLDPKYRLNYLVCAAAILVVYCIFRWDQTLVRVYRTSFFFGLDPREFINGSLFCRFSSVFCANALIPVFGCVAAAGQFAGEYQDGTLRTLLSSSASRTKLFTEKLMTLMIFILSLNLFVFVLSYLVGVFAFGHGELIAGANDVQHAFRNLRTIPETAAFIRGCAAVMLATLDTLPVLALGILISILTLKSLASVTISLSLIFGILILKFMPFDAPLPFEHLLFTHHPNSWGDIFIEVIPWKKIVTETSFQVAWGFSLLLPAWGVFLTRDFRH